MLIHGCFINRPVLLIAQGSVWKEVCHLRCLPSLKCVCVRWGHLYSCQQSGVGEIFHFSNLSGEIKQCSRIELRGKIACVYYFEICFNAAMSIVWNDRFAKIIFLSLVRINCLRRINIVLEFIIQRVAQSLSKDCLTVCSVHINPIMKTRKPWMRTKDKREIKTSFL